MDLPSRVPPPGSGGLVEVDGEGARATPRKTLKAIPKFHGVALNPCAWPAGTRQSLACAIHSIPGKVFFSLVQARDGLACKPPKLHWATVGLQGLSKRGGSKPLWKNAEGFAGHHPMAGKVQKFAVKS